LKVKICVVCGRVVQKIPQRASTPLRDPLLGIIQFHLAPLPAMAVQ